VAQALAAPGLPGLTVADPRRGEENHVDEPAVFELANRTLNGVVGQIRDDQWAMEMPASFATRRTDAIPSLRQIIEYHAYDDAWVPDMVGGRTMEEVGKDKFDGDLLGEDPRASFARMAQAACVAVGAVTDLDATVHCSFGDYTVREYLWQINSFRGLRAHDIAEAIGVDSRLPDELVQGLWEEIGPHAEQWRAIGVFPAAVPVPDDAPLQDRLLGLTGRCP
jgi:uncharacterized protein (TIGR03086 family)